MYRRSFLNLSRCLAATVLALSVLGCSSLTAQPRFNVSYEQLQQVVGKRFPLRYPVVGLVDLTVQAPAVRLLPEQNRLNALMTVEAAGAALHRKQTGTFEVDFALRYEASDRTIRATNLRFRQLSFPGLLPAASEMINVLGPSLAEKSLKEVVLHQVRPQDLAMADGMGMQPGSITVTDKGLEIGFVAKAP